MKGFITFMFMILTYTSCQSPERMNATVPVRVGEGDDQRAHRDFRIHAKGESVVLIIYKSNDPRSFRTDTIDIAKLERLIEIIDDRK